MTREALLTMADYNGTLAAVRSLGRAGVPVVIADSNRLAPARWSRYVVRKFASPDVSASPERFVEWLAALGARAPGAVLHATSDDTAFLFARHRDLLASSFEVAVAHLDAIVALLDKWRLWHACIELGIDTPATWLPKDEDDVPTDLRFPLVIKPRTQAFLSPHQKGRVVRAPEDLRDAYRDFRDAVRHGAVVLEHEPDALLPLLQELVDHGAAGIYNLSGFIDASGELFVVEASRKILQWPRQLGVGLCFEESTVDPKLARDVERLCRRVGYHGAFEVEFVEHDGRRELIDFNPRFYGQMAFDVGRGLDLPLLVHLEASGERAALRDAVLRARESTRREEGRTYCNRIELELVLRLLRLAGATTNAEGARWHAWLARHDGHMVDAVLDGDDWKPAAVGALAAVVQRAAHPRSTWRAARSG